MSFFSKIKSTFFEEVDEPEREEAKNIEEITPVETFKPREEKIENVDNNRNLKRAEFTLYEDETEDDFAVAKTQSFKVVPMEEEKPVEKPLRVIEQPKKEEKIELRIQKEIVQPQKNEIEESVKRVDETRPFRPSSIVSPVFGIIDKNPLKKYEAPKVKNEKDKILDGIRTYVTPMGIKTVAVKDEKENKEVKKEENIVDLKEEKAVPNVKNVTIEDASEYYNDLGLEYNVNYKDNRVSSVDEFSEDDEIKTTRKVEKEKTAKMLQEESDKNKKNQDPTDEEDLFNLIESMYEKDN
jgi:hypothetical protein